MTPPVYYRLPIPARVLQREISPGQVVAFAVRGSAVATLAGETNPARAVAAAAALPYWRGGRRSVYWVRTAAAVARYHTDLIPFQQSVHRTVSPLQIHTLPLEAA